ANLHAVPLGLLLVYVDEQHAALLGYADVLVAALYGHEFAVLRGAHGIEDAAEVHTVHLRRIDTDLAAVQAIVVDRPENFFRHFHGNIDAHAFAFCVRAVHADVQPALSFDVL